jgi:hypothetical protein
LIDRDWDEGVDAKAVDAPNPEASTKPDVVQPATDAEAVDDSQPEATTRPGVVQPATDAEAVDDSQPEATKPDVVVEAASIANTKSATSPSDDSIVVVVKSATKFVQQPMNPVSSNPVVIVIDDDDDDDAPTVLSKAAAEEEDSQKEPSEAAAALAPMIAKKSAIPTQAASPQPNSATTPEASPKEGVVTESTKMISSVFPDDDINSDASSISTSESSVIVVGVISGTVDASKQSLSSGAVDASTTDPALNSSDLHEEASKPTEPATESSKDAPKAAEEGLKVVEDSEKDSSTASKYRAASKSPSAPAAQYIPPSQAELKKRAPSYAVAAGYTPVRATIPLFLSKRKLPSFGFEEGERKELQKPRRSVKERSPPKSKPPMSASDMEGMLHDESNFPDGDIDAIIDLLPSPASFKDPPSINVPARSREPELPQEPEATEFSVYKKEDESIIEYWIRKEAMRELNAAWAAYRMTTRACVLKREQAFSLQRKRRLPEPVYEF